MDTWTLTIKSEDHFNGKNYIISENFNENINKKLNIKNINIILPKTQAPFNHGYDNDNKNIKEFPYFFKKVLVTFKNLEELKIINLWPWCPAYIFEEFDDLKNDYIKNNNTIANNLKKLDLGFLGYNVLEVNILGENIIDFLGSGILKHLDRISWKTRCNIDDHIKDSTNYKFIDNLHNVYWEGYNIVDYINNNEKNMNFYI